MDKIIIENFKIFKGEHTFDLNNLNIFTGANNAGKSTLIKAISLFAKGLEKGDFPSIDLFENNAGEFKNLVNWKSGAESFKIGFYIHVGKNKIPFKVMYEFVDGENVGYREERGKAVFANFEVFDENNRFFFGLYSAKAFKVTKENLEYDYDFSNKSDEPSFPFRCALEDNNPPEMFMGFSIPNLRKNLKYFTDNRFPELFKKVRQLHPKDIWWMPRFIEEDYYDIGLSELSLQYLLKDIDENDFYELLDYDSSEILFYSAPEEDQVTVWESYKKILEETQLEDFIEQVITPVIGQIDKGLNIFRKKNLIHISFQKLNERLFEYKQENQYLINIYQSRDYDEMYSFTRESLKRFGIDGFVELESHLNKAIAINLVTNLEHTDSHIDKKKLRKFERYFINYKKRYAENPRKNIADLGKGTAGLIGLILKVFSVLENMDIERSKSMIKNNSKTKERKTEPKIILIEEPEAFLHPAYQSKLADFFVFCLKRTERDNVKFIVETHSEYLIRKLQYLTAKKVIAPDDTRIYYFHNPDNIPEGEKQIKELTIREDGMMDEDFGPGFFDESTRLTIDLLKLQNRN